MKSTVERLSPTRVRINVEVPFDELKPDFDRAYKKIAEQVRVPGFRPGKVPARIIEARLGRGVVLEEVVNGAVPAKYSEAVSAADALTPLGRPDIEVTEIADGDKLAFTAEVDVRPEITLPALDSLAVSVDDVEVTDEDVTEGLDNLRARFGTLTGVDRPAATDDFVQIDLAAAVDGEPVEEATTSGYSYQVGQGGLIDGIDEAITGLSAGESATFPTTLVAGEYADQDADVTVTVTAVKERQLPDADDEFAQLASEFDTLDELTDDLRTAARPGQADGAGDAGPRPGARRPGRGGRRAAAGERGGHRGGEPHARRGAHLRPRRGALRGVPGRAGPDPRGVRRQHPGRGRAVGAHPAGAGRAGRLRSRSRSATPSSPSASSCRPSSTGCRRRSSSGGSRRPASSGPSTPTCGGPRRSSPRCARPPSPTPPATPVDLSDLLGDGSEGAADDVDVLEVPAPEDGDGDGADEPESTVDTAATEPEPTRTG